MGVACVLEKLLAERAALAPWEQLRQNALNREARSGELTARGALVFDHQRVPLIERYTKIPIKVLPWRYYQLVAKSAARRQE